MFRTVDVRSTNVYQGNRHKTGDTQWSFQSQTNRVKALERYNSAHNQLSIKDVK